MSGGFELRPAAAEEIEALVEVFRAEDLWFRGRSAIDTREFEERVAADPGFDAARDQVIADLDGVVVGAAILRRRGVMLGVHPDHDLSGLRETLLSWSEWRASELGRETLRVSIPATTRPTVALLKRAGYRLERFYAEMARDFATGGGPEAPSLPAGYRLDRVDRRRDRVALHALDARAFAERPDHLPESLAEYDAAVLAPSGFAPELSLLASSESGQPAASVIGARRSGRPNGYITVLAVDPAHQRRGLARAMLLSAFGLMHDLGLPGAELHVASDNPRALDLYRGVGMTEGERIEDYARRA